MQVARFGAEDLTRKGTGFKSVEQLPTLIGISWAAKQIKIPIIAAGGISDARTFLASLAMGAEAAYMGTVFMATRENVLSRTSTKNIFSVPGRMIPCS